MSFFIPQPTCDFFYKKIENKVNFVRRDSSPDSVAFCEEKSENIYDKIKHSSDDNQYRHLLLAECEEKQVPSKSEGFSEPQFLYELFQANNKYISSFLEQKPYSKVCTKSVFFSTVDLEKEFENFNIEIEYPEKYGDEKYFEILDSLIVDLDICRYKTGKRYLVHLNTSLRNVLNFLYEYKKRNILIANKDELDMKLKETQEKLSKSNYDYLFQIADLKHEVCDSIMNILCVESYKTPCFFDQTKIQLRTLNNTISEYYEYAYDNQDDIKSQLIETKDYFENLSINIMSFSKEIQALPKNEIENYISYCSIKKEDFNSVKDEFVDLYRYFEEAVNYIDVLCSAIEFIYRKK